MLTTDISQWIWMLGCLATWVMVGVIWFVQVVHYPLFDHLAQDSLFAVYAQRHATLTSIVVMPAMLVEAFTAGLLALGYRPAGVSGPVAWVGLALVALIWLSTFFIQVPMHHRLQSGFDSGTHQALVATNWIRTVLWSLRGVLVAWVMLRTSHPG